MTEVKHIMELVRKYGYPLLYYGMIVIAAILAVTVFVFGCIPLIGFLVAWVVGCLWYTDSLYQKELEEQLRGELGLKEKEITALSERLEGLLAFKNDIFNPIKSGRIVNDKTFAYRLIEYLKLNASRLSAYLAEKDYLLDVAERLLKWQVSTVHPGSSEVDYLKKIGVYRPALKRKQRTNKNQK